MLWSRETLQTLWLTLMLERFVKIQSVPWKMPHFACPGKQKWGIFVGHCVGNKPMYIPCNHLLKGSERVASKCSSCCGTFLPHPGPCQHECASEDRESGARLQQEDAGGAQQVQGQADILGRKRPLLPWWGEQELWLSLVIMSSVKVLTMYFQVKREICNLALGDLPAIVRTDGFVMNKFESEIDASVVDCLQHFVYS